MGDKITIVIDSKKFDISLDDSLISEKMREDILKDLKPDSNSLKDLLSAYLNRCYEYNKLLDKLEGIYSKIKKSS